MDDLEKRIQEVVSRKMIEEQIEKAIKNALDGVSDMLPFS